MNKKLSYMNLVDCRVPNKMESLAIVPFYQIQLYLRFHKRLVHFDDSEAGYGVLDQNNLMV